MTTIVNMLQPRRKPGFVPPTQQQVVQKSISSPKPKSALFVSPQKSKKSASLTNTPSPNSEEKKRNTYKRSLGLLKTPTVNEVKESKKNFAKRIGMKRGKNKILNKFLLSKNASEEEEEIGREEDDVDVSSADRFFNNKVDAKQLKLRQNKRWNDILDTYTLPADKVEHFLRLADENPQEFTRIFGKRSEPTYRALLARWEELEDADESDEGKYAEEVLQEKVEIVKEIKKKTKKSPKKTVIVSSPKKNDSVCTDVVLKKFQCGVGYHLLRNPLVRGVACFYKPGYGKTLTAVATSVILMKKGIIENIVAITPKSLRVNLKDEFNKCGSEDSKKALRKLTIYTYESLHENEIPKGITDKTLLICDEAHRLRESDTKTFRCIQNLSSKCARVLLLTATPFVNKMSDIMNLLHIINPGVPIKTQNETTTFDELRQYANGIVAFPDEDISNLFARREDHEVECNLDEEQLNELIDYDRKMKKLKRQQQIHDDVETQSKNSYLVKTRQISLGTFSKDGEAIASTKMLKLIENLEDPQNLPALVFTAFVDKGIRYIQNVFDKSDKALNLNLKIAEIHGQIKESQRDVIVKDTNAGKHNVVLLSDAGSEGLNFKGIRSVHLLGTEWNPSIVEQQIGRALRVNAHMHLPEAQRVVKVFKYLSVVPDDITEWKGTCIGKDSIVNTEKRLLEIQKRKFEEQTRAMDVLREVMISHDCENNEGLPKTVINVNNSIQKNRISMCSPQNFNVNTVFKGGNGIRYIVKLNKNGKNIWKKITNKVSVPDEHESLSIRKRTAH